MKQKSSLEYISVSKDAYDFLKHMLFGAWNSIYIAASERAYRDMCRTLRLEGVDSTKLRDTVDKMMEQTICSALKTGFEDQKQYDTWHRKICFEIQKVYTDNNADMTIGQAQKWLNMTMKYLFIADVPGAADVFCYCHVPIDSYIIDEAEKKLGLKRPTTPWSKIPDYEKYFDYQKEIRTRLGGIAPLEWEFKTWLTAAADKKEQKNYLEEIWNETA